MHVFSLNLTRWTTVVNVPHVLSDWKTKDSIFYHTQIWWEIENVLIPYAWSLLCLSTSKLARSKQASHPRWGREVREKKPTICFVYIIFVGISRFSQPRAIPIGKSSTMSVSASLSSHALRFQPRYRPFVWLLARTWIGKNTVCFAVYWALQQCVIYT